MVGCLNSPLGHHRICIAVPELGCNDHPSPMLLGHQRCRRPCSSPTDDEDIRLIGNLIEIDRIGIESALGLEEIHDLRRDRVALARTHPDLPP